MFHKQVSDGTEDWYVLSSSIVSDKTPAQSRDDGTGIERANDMSENPPEQLERGAMAEDEGRVA